MKNRVQFPPACILMVALVVAACDSGEGLPTSPLQSADNDELVDEGGLAWNKFFTGRDSFGVALEVRLDGEVNVTETDRCGTDETVMLSGSGNGTHLGQVEGDLIHCSDPDDPSDAYGGEFTFVGKNGSVVSGTYRPQPTTNGSTRSVRARDVSGVVATKAQITGGEITAVQRHQVEGRGDLSIVLKDDNSFTLILDGWLLHHTATDEE